MASDLLRDGLQPTKNASNLLEIASNLLEMASNLLEMDSNLLEMASNLLAMPCSPPSKVFMSHDEFCSVGLLGCRLMAFCVL